jgi:hypothetical protein
MVFPGSHGAPCRMRLFRRSNVAIVGDLEADRPEEANGGGS